MAKVYQDGGTKKSFMKKYFMAGQALDAKAAQEIPEDADFAERIFIKYRKYIAVIAPVTILLTLWTLTAIRYSWLQLFRTHWQLPLTMILGGCVSGLTAESGGAVAFPMMTLVMHFPPELARDFSILVEACGMVCAMASVFIMRVQLEERTIFFGVLGSLPGMVVGFEYLDKFLTGPQKKMLFVSIWSSFAVALFLLNRQKKRRIFMTIPDFKLWKGIVLVFTGFIGGILTAFTGSGVDICLFSIITVLFRVSEKSATPTTIMLMGINSFMGTYYRVVWQGDVPDLIWNYLKPTIPVVLIVIPIAHFIGSHFHRQVLAAFVYVIELLAILGFIITRPPTHLLVIGAVIIVVCFMFFYTMGKVGERLLVSIEEPSPIKKEAQSTTPV